MTDAGRRRSTLGGATCRPHLSPSVRRRGPHGGDRGDRRRGGGRRPRAGGAWSTAGADRDDRPGPHRARPGTDGTHLSWLLAWPTAGWRSCVVVDRGRPRRRRDPQAASRSPAGATGAGRARAVGRRGGRRVHVDRAGAAAQRRARSGWASRCSGPGSSAASSTPGPRTWPPPTAAACALALRRRARPDAPVHPRRGGRRRRLLRLPRHHPPPSRPGRRPDQQLVPPGWPGTMDEETVRAEVDGFAGVTARHGLALDDTASTTAGRATGRPATGPVGPLEPSGVPGWAAGAPGGGVGADVDRPVARPLRRLRRPPAGPAGVGPRPGRRGRRPHGLLCVAGDPLPAPRWPTCSPGGRRPASATGSSTACASPAPSPTTATPSAPAAAPPRWTASARLLAGARAGRPDVVVAFTIGSNPSPWWLRSADFLWRGGLDDSGAGYPGSRLDRSPPTSTPASSSTAAASVPVSALVTFSVVESEACRYRDPGENIADWDRHCWLIVGRGTQHHDLYVAPDSLSEAEWAVLAEALAWARQHRRVLARSRMVLGDPAAGEVYGFASRRGDEAVLCLRNPSPDGGCGSSCPSSRASTRRPRRPRPRFRPHAPTPDRDGRPKPRHRTRTVRSPVAHRHHRPRPPQPPSCQSAP